MIVYGTYGDEFEFCDKMSHFWHYCHCCWHVVLKVPFNLCSFIDDVQVHAIKASTTGKLKAGSYCDMNELFLLSFIVLLSHRKPRQLVNRTMISLQS